MRNEFEVAFNEIAELRSLPSEIVLEALQTALISAYRRYSGASAAQKVDASFDPNNGRARIFVEKEVIEEVDENFNATTEVELEKARYYDPECNVGDTIMVQVEGTTKKFGRIAAQTAKQVILQKIREAERDSLYEEYIEKEGDILTGKVQSITNASVTVGLGRTEATMYRAQQIPGERYKPHETIRVYLLEVKRSNRGPQILVSRSHRNMLRRLLEFEVPEIYNGQVEIKNIAREAGYRSKVAVAALQDGIDPVGACVGMRGIRIQNIVKELHDEKIDIIEWNVNQEAFIAKALSPARVTGVYLDDDPDVGRTAVVVVPDEDLSLAIGREGQNARLAAKLTGWRIDIKSVTESVETALEHLDSAVLSPLKESHADMLDDIRVIMTKRENKLTVMPEDYKLLGKFATIAERKLLEARMEARKARLAEINAVKSTLPQEAFEISVNKLDLPDKIIESLEPLENVGEIMLRFLIDENRLRRLLGGNAEKALEEVQGALDKLFSEPEELQELLEEETADEAEVVAEAEEQESIEAVESEDVVDVPAEVIEEPVSAVEADAPAETIEDDVIPVAFPDDFDFESEEEAQKKARRRKEKERQLQAEADVEDEEDFEDEEEFNEDGSRKSRKKERNKRRQLIYDEELGQTIAKRRRKGGRKRDDWSNEY